MPTLAELLATPPVDDTCPIAELLEKLDGEDRAALVAAFESMGAIPIWEALRGAKLSVSREKVGKHKKRACACARTA